jgi:hypothetical protein
MTEHALRINGFIDRSNEQQKIQKGAKEAKPESSFCPLCPLFAFFAVKSLYLLTPSIYHEESDICPSYG